MSNVMRWYTSTYNVKLIGLNVRSEIDHLGYNRSSRGAGYKLVTFPNVVVPLSAVWPHPEHHRLICLLPVLILSHCHALRSDGPVDTHIMIPISAYPCAHARTVHRWREHEKNGKDEHEWMLLWLANRVRVVTRRYWSQAKFLSLIYQYH